MRRKPVSKSTSRKVFRRSAGTHSLNLMNPRRMRGGIRL